MPYDESVENNNSENNSQNTAYNEGDTETVSSAQTIKESGLTSEEIANRIILQLQWNEDEERERDEQIIELLKQLNNESVSENDIDENEDDETEKEETGSPLLQLYEVSDNSCDNATVDILRGLYDITVSQNTLDNSTIMEKPMERYNVSESIGIFIALILLCILVYNVWKKD